ncbi:hypothetical protein BC827DRAFT_614403 [Russula dissimulans]|nr:hypothetical protein BC827DRAFT_614403 [Russula dissimulans]
MLLEDFLKKHPVPGEYKVQVYIEPGDLSVRLDEGQRLIVHFLLPARASRKRPVTGEGSSRKRKARAPPRPRVSNGVTAGGSDEDEDTDIMPINDSGDDDWMGPALASGSPDRAKRRRPAINHRGYRHHWMMLWGWRYATTRMMTKSPRMSSGRATCVGPRQPRIGR